MAFKFVLLVIINCRIRIVGASVLIVMLYSSLVIILIGAYCGFVAR